MLTKTLSALLAGKASVTLGAFHTPDGERIPFGLKASRLYGTKPTIGGRSGRGGGFDPDRWTLRALLAHEYGAAGTLIEGVTITLRDGERFDNARLAVMNSEIFPST